MIGFYEANAAFTVTDILDRVELLKQPDALSVFVVSDEEQCEALESMSPVDRSVVAVIILRRGMTTEIKRSMYGLVGATCAKNLCVTYSLDDLCEIERWEINSAITSSIEEVSAAWRDQDLVKFIASSEWAVLESECNQGMRASIQHVAAKYRSFASFILDRLVYESIAGKNNLLRMGNVAWLNSLELKEFTRFIDDLLGVRSDYQRNATALKDLVVEMSKDYQMLKDVAYIHQQNAPVNESKVIEVLVWLSAVFIFRAKCLLSTKVFSAAFISVFRAIEYIVDAVLLKSRVVQIRGGNWGYSLYIGNDKVMGFGSKWNLVKNEGWYRANQRVNDKVGEYVEYRNKLLLAHGLAHVNKEIANDFLSLATRFVEAVCDGQVSRQAWQSRYEKLSGLFQTPISKKLSTDISENTGVSKIIWYENCTAC